MKKQNKVAFFNILSVILLNGISMITAPLFSRILGDSGYGKTWRCWTSRPTDEQREATPW